ncbi:helix-turn-helix transcriptional regulator [Anaerolineales bacterium HSG24]|nr:helix-turn-helix transcriptional regulator [Anaerolineales bacterium HSG24]
MNEQIDRFGEKLRTLRKQHKITLKELARQTGYATHTPISDIETGKKRPSLEFAVRIASLFNISLDSLVDDDLELE